MTTETLLEREDIDNVLLDARSGEVEALTEFFAQVPAQLNVTAARVLPEIKDEYSQSTPLHMAAANGHTEVVELLLSIPKSDADAVKALVNAKNESGNTPLHWAALNGHLAVVKLLCEAGSDPFITNEGHHDVFYEADAHEEVIDYLLAKYDVAPVDDDGAESGAAEGAVEGADEGGAETAEGTIDDGADTADVEMQ